PPELYRKPNQTFIKDPRSCILKQAFLQLKYCYNKRAPKAEKLLWLLFFFCTIWILLIRELELKMNNKDIADIRKRFKLDTDLLKIAEIYNVYIKGDTTEVFHEESRSFSLLDREQQ